MEVFKDPISSMPYAESAMAPGRMPLRPLNGSNSVAQKKAVEGSEKRLQHLGQKSCPTSLELRLGPSSSGPDRRLIPGNIPSKIQIGTVGSCLDAQTQVGYTQFQPKLRRPKRPTIIMKPREEPPKPVKPVLPCGLLSELKPGIIGRIRDSKQVQSIISAVLGNRKRPMESRPVTKPAPKQAKRDEQQESRSLSLEGMFFKDEEMDTGSKPDSEPDDIATENCDATLESGQTKLEKSDEDLDTRIITTTHSNPAAVWIKLINQDLKGRMSALKRSRRRVRTTIVAKDENIFVPPTDAMIRQALGEHQDPAKVKRQFELQMDKWKALFHSMDNALGLEATELEGQWRKLQQMQYQVQSTDCQCDKQN